MRFRERAAAILDQGFAPAVRGTAGPQQRGAEHRVLIDLALREIAQRAATDTDFDTAFEDMLQNRLAVDQRAVGTAEITQQPALLAPHDTRMG